jgi:transketolase
MAASHYGVDGLTAILDYNGLQVDGDVDSLMAIEPLTDKWKAFGWWVQEIDGHDTAQIATSLLHAREVKGKPGIIVAHTVKGKGVSFLEGRYEWHAGGLTREQRDRAMKELE